MNKRFEIARKIYNSLIVITQNKYKETTKAKKYNQLFSKISEDKKKNTR